MERQDRLRYCKACSHHRFDAGKGVICSITNEQASFIETCTTYKEDPELKHQMEMDNIRAQMMNEEVGKGTRFLNYLLDLVVIIVLNMIVGLFLGILIGAFNPDLIYLFDSKAFNYLIGAIVIFTYFTIIEGTTGTSLGKLITGTKVVDEDGKRPTLNTVMIRSVSRLVPFDNFSFFGDHGWHDKWSNTKVVKVVK